ncbi:MAG: GNAT family N-acetyltransferase [Phycisphaeraceae bacterium]
MQIELADVERVIPLRHAVLRAGLPAELARFEGDDAPGALHLAAVEQGEVVGCVTCMPSEDEGAPAWRLRGMAVADGWRDRGVGSALLEAVERELCQRPGPRRMWCNARVPAVRFYEERGWRSVTEPFDIPTAGPHRKMTRTLECGSLRKQGPWIDADEHG